MEVLFEKLVIYLSVTIFIVVIIAYYLYKQKRDSRIVEEKIAIAKEEGLHEPVTLHPVIDVNSCIKSGACISACPEKDIIGIKDGKATIINASHCVGHGACFHACPVQAITLYIGTEKRGVELPHVDQTFESNVPGVYIAGEMGGMGLIKNSVEQGKQAVENLSKKIDKNVDADYDLIIVGAGPAGISASLTAKKNKISALTLEQDSLGGTVFTFPRSKIVMTSAMDLPLHGKVKLFETSKLELLNIWNEVLSKNEINLKENAKVESITPTEKYFVTKTLNGDEFTSRKVLLAIGRRGSPRKLNVEGEESMKVAYRLLEPEFIEGKKVLVVGGGDSAIESALLLADQNQVTLSYRSEVFGRLKPKNSEKIKEAIANNKIKVLFNSNLTKIEDHQVKIRVKDQETELVLENDQVYIFAGGELPTQFLEKIGIRITKKFGEAILKHEK
ncbi:MAG: NAD(P)-binding domain-containing protein [Prolixibacteraceae bacterium]|nr:NAD(P)-binding domain-containing protein [Prolixibacteraceae bacterium]